MSLVLAIVPEPARLDAVHAELTSSFAAHDLVIATSVAEAIDAIDRSTPDLILVDPRFTPAEERRLVVRLRQLPGGAEIERLAPVGGSAGASDWFYWFTRTPISHPEEGDAEATASEGLVSRVWRTTGRAVRRIGQLCAAAGRKVVAGVRSVEWSRHAGTVKNALVFVVQARVTRYAAAAAILLVAGIKTSRSGWFTAKPEAEPPLAPVAAAAAPAPPEHKDKVKPTGELTLTSNPDGATVLVDGKPRGVTPLTLQGITAGTHMVTFQSDAGVIRRSIAVQAGKTASYDAVIYSGWMALFSPIEVQISEGGRPLRLDDDNRIMLPAGRHELQLVNQTLGYYGTKIVEITPGETAPISISLPRSVITVFAKPTADVWIDGAHVGPTPVVEFPVNLGTREVLLKNPAFPDHRVTVTVTTSKSVVDVDMTRP